MSTSNHLLYAGLMDGMSPTGAKVVCAPLVASGERLCGAAASL